MNPIVRKLSIVGALVLLFGAAVLTQVLMRQKTPPPRKAVAAEPLRKVKVVAVRNGPVATSLRVQGQLSAYEKIDLFTEVTGVLEATAKPFKVGSYFKQGETLLRINDEENRLSLLSQKSSLLNAIAQILPDLKIDYPESFASWKSYLDTFEVNRIIAPLPEAQNEREKLFIAGKNLHTQYYNIRSAENRLEKYRIRAPFSGVLTAASIHPGSLVRAGQSMGTLMNAGVYELEATVALSDLQYLRVGAVVELFSDDLQKRWRGKVARVSDQIDPNTQTVLTFVRVTGSELREGMYLKGTVQNREVENVYEIPREWLVNQNAVYVLRDSSLYQQEVDIVYEGDQAVIVRGLPDGTRILGEKVLNAFDGMKVAPRPVDPALSVRE